jgi:hypothetical protein
MLLGLNLDAPLVAHLLLLSINTLKTRADNPCHMDFVVKKPGDLFGYEDTSDVASDPRADYPYFLSVAVSCICQHIMP